MASHDELGVGSALTMSVPCDLEVTGMVVRVQVVFICNCIPFTIVMETTS